MDNPKFNSNLCPKKDGIINWENVKKVGRYRVILCNTIISPNLIMEDNVIYVSSSAKNIKLQISNPKLSASKFISQLPQLDRRFVFFNNQKDYRVIDTGGNIIQKFVIKQFDDKKLRIDIYESTKSDNTLVIATIDRRYRYWVNI